MNETKFLQIKGLTHKINHPLCNYRKILSNLANVFLNFLKFKYQVETCRKLQVKLLTKNMYV